MEKDQAIGISMLIGSIILIIIYGYTLFFSGWTLFVLQITVFVAVGAILAILAWIGWTMATTPAPKPIDEDLSNITESEESSEEKTQDTKEE